MPCAKPPQRPPLGLTANAFRPQVRWAVDHLGPSGYAHTLPPHLQRWLARFNREYYGADNELLNPATHERRCARCRHEKECRRCVAGRACRKGVALGVGVRCERKPHAQPLHRSRKLKRELFVDQNRRGRDAMSMGRADFIDDVTVDPTGERWEPDSISASYERQGRKHMGRAGPNRRAK